MLRLISKLWRSDYEQTLLDRKRGYRIISTYFKSQKPSSGGFVLLTNKG